MAPAAASKPLLPFLPPERLHGLGCVVGGEDSKEDGDPGVQGCFDDTLLGTGGNVVKVGGLAPYYSAEADYGIVAAAASHLFGHNGQFQSARGPGHVNGVLGDAVGIQPIQCAFKEPGSYGLVELGYGDADPEALAEGVALECFAH